MRPTIKIAVLASALVVAVCGQTPGKAEFEAASIKSNPPEMGFHFAADSVFGGPGSANPGMFRCSKCSLATLILRAFKLQPYQLPARTSLTGNTYDIVAKIPAGASEEEFSAMLQNLLKDRYGLTWHFEEKKMRGYHLVVAKDGPKLVESTAGSTAAPQRTESHSHSGAVAFGAFASYRAANQRIADLVRVLSDQIGLPVDDETGLQGRYDVSLRWSGNGAAHDGNHSDGGFSGGGHAGHDGGGGGLSSGAAGSPTDGSGPTLYDALQQQLGLKLVAAEQTVTRLFVIDRVNQRPTEN